MSRSMDSIATNDDFAATGAAIEEEKQEQLPSDTSKAKENINTVEISENTENIDAQLGDTVTGLDKHGENTDNSGNAATVDETAERPKRNARPSTKSIENRIQSDEDKLERLWEKVLKATSHLQDVPNSVDEISTAISQVRLNFNSYQSLWLSFMDFLAYAGTSQCLEVRERMERVMNNYKQFVHENITQGNERKEEILLEMRSVLSGSGSRASSMSSTTLRARARAEAAAAAKKAEMQKKRSVLETQSALAIQQEELALAKRKLDEHARLEALRLEEAAAVALAKADAIDDELGFRAGDELHPLNLPKENANQRVKHFIENQCTSPILNTQACHSLSRHDQLELGTQSLNPQPLNPQPHHTPERQPLNPMVNTFIPNPPLPSSSSDQSMMKSYIEFMARRELIANKIEKFDNNPENFHTWKSSFKNMTNNINITPSEELSLIMEYTTNDSKRLVQKLRNAYMANPEKGVAEVWTKLGERYGSNVVLTKAHLDKLTNFPKIGFKDNKKLQDFGDLLLELQCAKEDGHLQGLRILDEPIYLRPVLTKLPGDIQSRWQRHAFRYKRDHKVDHPPFAEFSKFIQDVSLERNDPNLAIERPDNEVPLQRTRGRHPRQSYKTEITDPSSEGEGNIFNPSVCIIHRKPHPLTKCRAFQAKTIEERRNLLRQHHLCFRCLASTTHMAKDCKLTIKFSECGSDKHLAALHVERPGKPKSPAETQGGEQSNGQQDGKDETVKPRSEDPSRITTSCTEICGYKPGGKSCSKICLAKVYVKDRPDRKVKVYAVIDDQSNCSLAKPQLLDALNIDGASFPYTLRTCAGTTQTKGRHASGLVIESLDGNKQHLLPPVTECDAIPDNKDEIPTPDVATAHQHLRPIANQIPQVQHDVDILLLIGRDAPPLHKVRESRNGRGNSPWAQRLDLGWVILGNACLDGVHKPDNPSSFKTNILHNGRPSIFEPCANVFHVEQVPSTDGGPYENTESYRRKETFVRGTFEDGLARDVFERTKIDDTPGLSVEDRKFLEIMGKDMKKDPSGSWVAPLPFRQEVHELPNSRDEALKRLKSTSRMKVHLFGNTSSPAVATFGLRKTANVGEAQFGSDAKEFVERNFYVDDGLKSLPTSEQSIDLLRRTKAMLATANLRLHKIASNDAKVTQAFPSEDRASNLCDLDLNSVYWDLETDTFTFHVSREDKPFTRRGVLSTINSLFDPLGIASPVIIKGKMLLRSMSGLLKNHPLERWDEVLPEEYHPAWKEWYQSLSCLQHIKIPRSYTSAPLSEASRIELHVFCDASVHGIAAVCYLRCIQPDGKICVSFVFGKAKLAPSHATTIPRLELCAAVLAVEITQLVTEEQAVKPDSITYYSDSKVVLGYITNETRRFYVYVSNRVERIRKSSSPEEWRYVPTHLNPADCATRSVKANELGSSMWLIGPKFLKEQSLDRDSEQEQPVFEWSTDDPEVRPAIKALVTKVQTNPTLETRRFTRFSRWSSLVKGVSLLILAARSYHNLNQGNGAPPGNPDEATGGGITDSVIERRRQAEIVIIKSAQHEVFAKEIDQIKNGEKLSKGSALVKLNPVIDSDGLLRVGGRLDRAELTIEERHPVILPGSHHIATLVVKHYHNEVKHQGRHFTHGLIRAKGYWIIGGKRLVNRVIYQCVRCRKLRGQQANQKMADLPVQRLTPAPPFTFVGLDVFGPWQVVTRRTRGGVAYNKRWAVIFTCLTIRAIHIELIESMDTSSFINALRRFVAVRGPVKQLRSDCGTNFVGARNELTAATKEMDNGNIAAYLANEGCEWIFNPPHASHAGGVWERMIGIARRILDAMLSEVASKRLTHEVLSTLMAEVTAIVNNRPLTPVSEDPEAPEILTPFTLLTQKSTVLTGTPGRFTSEDLHAAQWRQVQYLANIFWSRWRREFLPLLQTRRKWQHDQPNLREGDLVLLRSKEIVRNMWPLARITKVHESADGKVRKVELMTAKDGVKREYTRPVTEVILLRTVDELKSLC